MDILSGEGLKFIAAIGIGTIISSVISFWRDRKKSQLEYITNKRSEWRNEIRQIVDAFNSDGSLDVSSVYQLMVRINPEGIDIADKIEGTNKWYMNNSHIWAILSKESISDSDTKKLITYLSLLLNKEWEKSKKETYLNKMKGLDIFIKLNLAYTSLALSVIYILKSITNGSVREEIFNIPRESIIDTLIILLIPFIVSLFFMNLGNKILPVLMIEINDKRNKLNKSREKTIDYNPFYLFSISYPKMTLGSTAITFIMILCRQRISMSLIVGIAILGVSLILKLFYKIVLNDLFDEMKKNLKYLIPSTAAVLFVIKILWNSLKLRLDYIYKFFEEYSIHQNEFFLFLTFVFCLFFNLILNSNSNYIKSYWTSLFILLDGLTTYYLITTIPTLANIGITKGIWKMNPDFVMYLTLFLIVLGILQMFVTYSKLAEREVNKQYIITLKGLDSQEELK